MRLLPLYMFKPSSYMYIFTDSSKVVLLLWILFVIYVLCLSLLCCLVYFLQACDHLLGKGWPLGSLVCDVFLCLFVCLFVVLRPKSTAIAMVERSVHLTTIFPGQT